MPDGGVFVPGGTGLAGTSGSSAGLAGSTGAGGGFLGAAGAGGSAGGTSGQKISPGNGCRCDAGPGASGGWLVLLALAGLVRRRARRAR